jgi:hypothetical protein
VGASVGGELYPSWMHFFPSPFIAFIFHLLLFLSFYFKVLTRGHCLGVVTRADSVTHWYFRRNYKAGS